MKVQEYLDRVVAGLTQEQFEAEFPHHVLMEVDAQPGGEAPADALTERLDSQAIIRQSLASKDAQVFAIARKDGGKGPVVVGRASDCDILVDHQSVSKEHARFIWSKKKLQLEDKGSTNGTMVNAKRLEKDEPHTVQPDDAIHFGRATGFHLMDPTGFWHYLCLLRRFGL